MSSEITLKRRKNVDWETEISTDAVSQSFKVISLQIYFYTFKTINNTLQSNKALTSLISSIHESVEENIEAPDSEAKETPTVTADKEESEQKSLPMSWFSALKEMFTTDFDGIIKKGE